MARPVLHPHKRESTAIEGLDRPSCFRRVSSNDCHDSWGIYRQPLDPPFSRATKDRKPRHAIETWLGETVDRPIEYELGRDERARVYPTAVTVGGRVAAPMIEDVV